MMNGTTVYRISIGRLYRTWCGTRSERLRKRTTAAMIRPQTMMPTHQAATQDPCHRVTITLACLVIGTGAPIRVNALDWQPAVASSTAAAMTALGTPRRARRDRRAPVLRGWGP